MASEGTRPGRLLALIETLRRDRSAMELELLHGGAEAEADLKFLVKLGLAEKAKGVVYATEAVDQPLTEKQLEEVEDHVLGQAEARDFRRLMGLSGGLRKAPVGDEEPPRLKGPDEDTVKKYAKSFLDVSEIAMRQRGSKAGGG